MAIQKIGFLPPNCLGVSPGAFGREMSFLFPGAYRHISVAFTDAMRAGQTKRNRYHLYIPPTFLQLHFEIRSYRKELYYHLLSAYMWAVVQTDTQVKLKVMPLPNTYDNGMMCLGGFVRMQKTLGEVCDLVFRALWSNFNLDTYHSLIGYVTNVKKKDLTSANLSGVFEEWENTPPEQVGADWVSSHVLPRGSSLTETLVSYHCHGVNYPGYLRTNVLGDMRATVSGRNLIWQLP